MTLSDPPRRGSATAMVGGLVVYTPLPDVHGPDGFSYRVCDGAGNCTTGRVRVTVLPVNDPPETADDAAETATGSPIGIDPLANDHDVDGDSLTLGDLGRPSVGSVRRQRDGTLLYVPGAGPGPRPLHLPGLRPGGCLLGGDRHGDHPGDTRAASVGGG